jgi:hypothetical protein
LIGLLTSRRAGVAIDLAVILMAIGDVLAHELRMRSDAASGYVGVHQHGYALTNYQAQIRACKFGLERDTAAQCQHLLLGGGRAGAAAFWSSAQCGLQRAVEPLRTGRAAAAGRTRLHKHYRVIAALPCSARCRCRQSTWTGTSITVPGVPRCHRRGLGARYSRSASSCRTRK